MVQSTNDGQITTGPTEIPYESANEEITKKFMSVINIGVEIYTQHDSFCTDSRKAFHKIVFVEGDDIDELEKSIRKELNSIFIEEK